MESKETCKFCDKKFSSSSTLNRHIRDVHKVKEGRSTTESNFKCIECEKFLSSQSALNRHIKDTHRNENDTCKM